MANPATRLYALGLSCCTTVKDYSGTAMLPALSDTWGHVSRRTACRL